MNGSSDPWFFACRMCIPTFKKFSHGWRRPSDQTRISTRTLRTCYAVTLCLGFPIVDMQVTWKWCMQVIWKCPQISMICGASLLGLLSCLFVCSSGVGTSSYQRSQAGAQQSAKQPNSHLSVCLDGIGQVHSPQTWPIARDNSLYCQSIL